MKSFSNPKGPPLEWALALLAIAGALVALFLTIKTAALPMQFDYEEGNILNAGLRIVHGQTPYAAPHEWPMVFNPYGPIGYLAVAALIKLFGVNFLAARTLSIVSAALIAFLIGALVKHFGGSTAVSVIFACAFLSVANIRIWLVTCRVDWLGLALSLAGLAVFVFWEKRWYWVAFLFVAALFVKYTLLAAPLACAICLIQRRDWKMLWKLAAMGGALCLLGYFVSQWWSGGNFWFHELRTHPDSYSVAHYLELVGGRIRHMPVLFGIASIAAIGDFWRKRATLPVVYLLTALVGTLSAGKVGSNSNHLFELTAAVCLAAGCGWHLISNWLLERNFRLAQRLWLVGVAASILITFVHYRSPFPAENTCAPLYGYLHSRGDSVLTDGVGTLLLAGKPVLLSNPFVYAQLVSHGGWPDTEVRDRVRRKEFNAIVLREPIDDYAPGDRFTAGTLEAIKANYHFSARFDCYYSKYAYLPNP